MKISMVEVDNDPEKKEGRYIVKKKLHSNFYKVPTFIFFRITGSPDYFPFRYRKFRQKQSKKPNIQL